MDGITSTLTSWNAGVTRLTGPPRATFTRLPRGSTLGLPGHKDQQMRILKRTLALLNENAPLEPVTLDERE
jgi:hypothetical protein